MRAGALPSRSPGCGVKATPKEQMHTKERVTTTESEQAAYGLHRFLNDVIEGAPTAEPPRLARCLREHLGTDPSAMEIVEERFWTSEHPNIQLALDELLDADGRSFELLGIHA